MKSFIIKTFLFSLPIVILLIPMEFLLRNIPNDYEYKKNYFDTHSDDIQILFFGSSHTYYGINPDYFFQKSFNAAHVSQSLDFDFEILNMYNDKWDNLKVIVLTISYFSLYEKLENVIDAWRIKNYTLYYGINANSLSDNSELLSIQFKHNLSRLFNYYINNINEKTCSELGWGVQSRFENAKDLQETGKKAAKIHTYNDIYSDKNRNVLMENLEILNSFSEFCNQQNIKLIFITMPAYFTYRENLCAEQLNNTFDIINDFVKKHSNCFYINYLDDVDFVAEDFYDADHLNENGAKKLSLKLAHYIDLLDIFE